MTDTEFRSVMAYLTAGTGVALEAERVAVYHDLLGDLDYQTALTAAKRVLLEHRWGTFPSVAELRDAAAETLGGTLKALSPGEAWALAWRAVASTDPEVDGSFARATKHLPALVVEAIGVMGINPLCYGDEPVAVVRGQFLKIYEQLAAREKRRALYPADLTKAIGGEARKSLPVVRAALDGIGTPDEAA